MLMREDLDKATSFALLFREKAWIKPGEELTVFAGLSGMTLKKAKKVMLDARKLGLVKVKRTKQGRVLVASYM